MTMNEDAIAAHIRTLETLTDWCRAHVQPPPARLLYAAAHAVDCLRESLRESLRVAEPA